MFGGCGPRPPPMGPPLYIFIYIWECICVSNSIFLSFSFCSTKTWSRHSSSGNLFGVEMQACVNTCMHIVSIRKKMQLIHKRARSSKSSKNEWTHMCTLACILLIYGKKYDGFTWGVYLQGVQNPVFDRAGYCICLHKIQIKNVCRWDIKLLGIAETEKSNAKKKIMMFAIQIKIAYLHDLNHEDGYPNEH